MNKDGYVRRVVIAVSIVALFFLAWKLRDVFIILFGALVFAIALGAGAKGIRRLVPVSDNMALAAVVLGTAGVLVALFWFVGAGVAAQFSELRTALPRAVDSVVEWLHSSTFGPPLVDLYESAKEAEVPWSNLATYATAAVNGVTNAVLIPIVGLYLAASPSLYGRGLLQLMPDHDRKRVAIALGAAGTGLQGWLFGQMFSMIAIGIMTTVGLLLLGMPLALPVGLIAGLLAFVPFFGPIASGILAVVLAFTEGPMQALYVGLLCIAIQQIESFVLMPLIQRRTVSLPPVLGLISVVIFGLLFGLIGVVFATPLMVVLMILVQKLYVDKNEANAT